MSPGSESRRNWPRSAFSTLSPFSRSEVPGRAGVAEIGAGDDAGTVHLPDVHGAARILEQDVGAAVFVVVAHTHDVPARVGVGDGPAADCVGPVHLPDVDLAAVVLPKDVGKAVVVEIPSSDGAPSRAGIARLPPPITMAPFSSQM